MLKPLEQFICDSCGEVINSRKEGWIEWSSEINPVTGKFETQNYKIVHHDLASPNTKNGCYYNLNMTSHLDNFMDPNYFMARILKPLDIGPLVVDEYEGSEIIDIRQFVETVRRLTIPYFEEARIYFEEAKEDGYFEGMSEYKMYSVSVMKDIIEKYRK